MWYFICHRGRYWAYFNNPNREEPDSFTWLCPPYFCMQSQEHLLSEAKMDMATLAYKIMLMLCYIWFFFLPTHLKMRRLLPQKLRCLSQNIPSPSSFFFFSSTLRSRVVDFLDCFEDFCAGLSKLGFFPSTPPRSPLILALCWCVSSFLSLFWSPWWCFLLDSLFDFAWRTSLCGGGGGGGLESGSRLSYSSER